MVYISEKKIILQNYGLILKKLNLKKTSTIKYNIKSVKIKNRTEIKICYLIEIKTQN